MLLADLHLVPPSPASAVSNQFSLKFSKTSQDVNQQVVRGTLFAGQFTKDHLYALVLQIAFDDP
jgi:hypothetical protein